MDFIIYFVYCICNVLLFFLDFQKQSFTSNWPKALWLAIDQRGLHLLEHRTRHILCNYDYSTLISVSPTLNCLMVITGTDSKPSKVILNTHQVNFSKLSL